eukprot:281427-Chlamydomonas_euryale.AAC.2
MPLTKMPLGTGATMCDHEKYGLYRMPLGMTIAPKAGPADLPLHVKVCADGAGVGSRDRHVLWVDGLRQAAAVRELACAMGLIRIASGARRQLGVGGELARQLCAHLRRRHLQCCETPGARHRVSAWRGGWRGQEELEGRECGQPSTCMMRKPSSF